MLRPMFRTPGAAILAQWAYRQGEEEGTKYVDGMMKSEASNVSERPTWAEITELFQLSMFCGSSEFEDPETGNMDGGDDRFLPIYQKILAKVKEAEQRGWSFWLYVPGHGYYAVVAMDPSIVVENGPAIEPVEQLASAQGAEAFFTDLLNFYTEA